MALEAGMGGGRRPRPHRWPQREWPRGTYLPTILKGPTPAAQATPQPKDTIADYAERRWQARAEDEYRAGAARARDLARRPWGQRVDWREPFWIPPKSAPAFQQRVFQGYGFAPEAQGILAREPAGALRQRFTKQITGLPAGAASLNPRWRQALEKGPITFAAKDLASRGGGGGWAPWFGEIGLESAQDEAALHEMAHAWADMTGFYDKQGQNLAFRRAVQRLAKEPDPRYARAAQLAYGYERGWGDWPGMGTNDAERFAGLASGVMGDTNQLPPYVRKFYEGLFTGEGVRVGLTKAPGPQMTRGPALPPPDGGKAAAPLSKAARLVLARASVERQRASKTAGWERRPWFPMKWKR